MSNLVVLAAQAFTMRRYASVVGLYAVKVRISIHHKSEFNQDSKT